MTSDRQREGRETALRTGIVHEALPYACPQDLLAGAVPFIRDGLEAGEAVIVAMPADRLAVIRDAVGPGGDVEYADMAEVGRNPRRIVWVWRELLRRHGPGRAVRGVGEPLWAGRDPDAADECHRHEQMLNLAFAGGPAWRLLCPYDTRALDPGAIRQMERTHPLVRGPDGPRVSPAYRPPDPDMPEEAPLPPPPAGAGRLDFGPAGLGEVRDVVGRWAATAGLSPDRAHDAVLAASEVASNSVMHGGGAGILRVWSGSQGLVCQVDDAGRIRDPLVGRDRPPPGQIGGHGLWLVNEVSDLVQVRVTAAGTTVRLRVGRG